MKFYNEQGSAGFEPGFLSTLFAILVFAGLAFGSVSNAVAWNEPCDNYQGAFIGRECGPNSPWPLPSLITSGNCGSNYFDYESQPAVYPPYPGCAIRECAGSCECSEYCLCNAETRQECTPTGTAGHERCTNKQVSSSCVITNLPDTYRCSTGYYGKPTSGTTGCTKCSTLALAAGSTLTSTQQATATTAGPGSETADKCYIPGGNSSNTTGSFDWVQCNAS
jgi:hypothetical protein